MSKNNIVIHFYITPECKMNCPFCYAFEHRTPGPPLTAEEVEHLIKACTNLGAKSIVFCGGDPFSRDDIVEIIKIAKCYNLTTRIDSNLLSYSPKIMDNLSKYLNWLALPLDGPTAQVHDMHRKWNGHFNTVMRMIHSLHTDYPHVDLKLHTLVTKENYDRVFEMPPLIRDISPSVWSIYTYFRAGVGRNNFRRYELSKSQIAEIKLLQTSNIGGYVDVVSTESHHNAYIFVAADGTVFQQPKLEGADYVVFGDFRKGALEEALFELDMEGNRRRARIYLHKSRNMEQPDS